MMPIESAAGPASQIGKQVGLPPTFRRRDAVFGFLLVVPTLFLFLGVILLPFLRSIGLAFFDSTLLNPHPTFVGLENFRELLTSESFWKTWSVTLTYVVLTTSLTVFLGFCWAIIMNQALRGRTIIRTISIIPWVLPSTVTAFLWAWIFNGQFGLLNALLQRSGLVDAPIAFLSYPAGAMTAIVLAKAWLSTPVAMSFVLAGLQTVSTEEIEAAMMDGCGAAGVIRNVIWPHILPTIAVVTVLQAMANLQQIDTILALTAGGPARGTTTLSIDVYQRAFKEWDMGMASAIGVVWFLTIAIPASIYLSRIFRRL